MTDPTIEVSPSWWHVRSALRGLNALRRGQGRNVGLMCALAVAVMIVAIPHPEYLTYANFRVVGLEMAYTMIAALGTAFLMIGGNIDLSIGSSLTVAAIVAALLANHIGTLPSFVVAVAVSGVIGLVNGILVWKVRLSPLIITLGSLTVFQGVAYILSNGYAIFNVPGNFTKLGLASVLGFPSALAIAIVLIPISWVVLTRTTFGQYTFAIGGNRAASVATGLNVRRIVISTFAINGILIGLIGVLEASRFGDADPRSA